MPNINIIVRDKVAEEVEGKRIVCGNSGYVAVFDFDEEWAGYDTKTARFIWNDKCEDVLFSGNECPIPVITNAFGVLVGVYAGDLHTTTAATIDARKSILCKNGVPADPRPDVYNQLMELLKELQVGGVTPEQIEAAVDAYFAENPSAAIPFEIGNALELKDGVLNVLTTNTAEQDNTMPITSSGVHTIVGNIGAILDTI